MTEIEALAKVEAAARGVIQQREDLIKHGRPHGESLMELILALRDLDKLRETEAEREAKRIHFFQERRESGNVLASCGLIVSEDEVRLIRDGIKCPGCQETFRGKYCPGCHPGTECLPSCWGYVMPGEIKREGGK